MATRSHGASGVAGATRVAAAGRHRSADPRAGQDGSAAADGGGAGTAFRRVGATICTTRMGGAVGCLKGSVYQSFRCKTRKKYQSGRPATGRCRRGFGWRSNIQGPAGRRGFRAWRGHLPGLDRRIPNDPYLADEITVVALTRGRPVSQPAISQHLRSLKEAGPIAERCAGRNTHQHAEP
jgi:hypothetical protein